MISRRSVGLFQKFKIIAKILITINSCKFLVFVFFTTRLRHLLAVFGVYQSVFSSTYRFLSSISEFNKPYLFSLAVPREINILGCNLSVAAVSKGPL